MGRRSKVEQLPAEVKDWLDKALVKDNFSGYEALAAELTARGLEVSRSGLHRYGSKLERRLAAIKASTEAAKLIDAAAPDDADSRSSAVISMVQTELFEAMVAFQEAENADPGERLTLVSKAAKNIATLARASVNQKKWMVEMREKAQAAANQVAKIAKKGGLSADVIKQIEEQVLGIVR